MNRFLFLATILFFHLSFSRAYGQCSGGVSGGALTPAINTAWQTQAVTGNRYYTFSATAGQAYSFSFCQGGGNPSGLDTQLTILDNSGIYVGAPGYNDDTCGLGSEIGSWTAPATGTYRILVNQYNCTTNTPAVTLAYRQQPPVGPGATCANPFNISSLPFNQTGMTTCGYGDDFSSADACTSSYMNGDDFVFTYNSPGNEQITINLTNTATWVGVFVTNGCPSTVGTMCLATSSTPCGGGATNTSVSGNPSGTWVLTSPGTYYITVSTFPAPQCTNFDINITSSPISSGGPGLGCYSISNPGYAPNSYTTGTQVVFPDDEFSNVIPIGFNFCFMGQTYSDFVISSNGYISFNNMCGGGYSSWDTVAIPTTLYPDVTNSIMVAWQDIDPSLGGTIRYALYGSAPNRKLVVSYDNIPMYGFSCSGQSFTGQIVLYEGTNIIDNYIQNKTVCAGWNNGEAVQGLLDTSGTVAVPVPGRNNVSWTATNDGVRYTPTCAPCSLPLPIIFSDFYGFPQVNTNKLVWEVAQGKNVRKFVLEKSNDRNNNFIEYQEVPFNSATTIYQVLDSDPSTKTFYRVVMVEQDGAKTFSDVIEVVRTDEFFGIRNLFVQGNNLQVEFEGITLNPIFNVKITNFLGQTVIEKPAQEVSNGLTLDLTGLSSGLYIIQISNGSLNLSEKFWYLP